MTPDMINGLFEAIGGLFVLNHVRALLKDKMVKGVSKLSTSVLFAWGLWNLYYYPSLAQPYSFAGGCVIVVANCIWLGLMLYYSFIRDALILNSKVMKYGTYEVERMFAPPRHAIHAAFYCSTCEADVSHDLDGYCMFCDTKNYPLGRVEQAAAPAA